MFYVVDTRGIYQPYVSGETPVGLRTEALRAVAPVRAVGPSEPHAKATKAPKARSTQLAAYTDSAQSPRRQLQQVVEIMSSPVVNVLDSDSLSEVVSVLKRSRVRHLPVVAETSAVVGILSERDVLRLRAETPAAELAHLTVRVAMTQSVLTARPAALIRDVARVMFEARVGAMPIVSETQRLIGIVTRSDILGAVVAHAPLELWG